MTDPSEKLFEEVLADGRTKADRARRRGRREAEAIRTKAAEEARAAAQNILAEARADAEARRTQILAMVEIEAKRERLAGIDQVLQAVHETAREQLGALETNAMRAAQLELALEALAQLPREEAEVALPPAAHQAYGEAFAGDLAARATEKLQRNVTVRPAAAPADVASGVVVRSVDGRMEVVNSLEERLRRLWPDLRRDVAAKLFPDLAQTKET
jgi:vacuolar-type H+-ATPase subunit E/Vma4